MGLRDFLLGAQQLQEGTKQYAEGSQKARQLVAQQQLQEESQDIITKIRGGTPEEQSAAAARYNDLSIQAGQKDQAGDQIFKYLLQTKRSTDQPLFSTPEEVLTVRPDYTWEEAVKVASLQPKAQSKAVDQKKDMENQKSITLRQATGIENTNLNKSFQTAEDFGSDFNKLKLAYDSKIDGLDTQYQKFVDAPLKQNAYLLAIAMGKSAGNAGAVTDKDADEVLFRTLDSDWTSLKNKIMNEPDGPLPQNIQEEYTSLTEKTLELMREKKMGVLRGQFKTSAAAVAPRLLKGGKKAPVIKQIEKEIGLETSINKDGGVEFLDKESTKLVGTHMKALDDTVKKIKTPSVRNGYLKLMKDNPNMSKDEAEGYIKTIEEQAIKRGR